MEPTRLLDTRPIVIPIGLTTLRAHFKGPDKAPEMLGIVRASIVQQFFWWQVQNRIENRTHYKRDGYFWTAGTARFWVDNYFPSISIKTFERHVRALTDVGIVIRGEFSTGLETRTSWYRVNTEEIQYLNFVENVGKKGSGQSVGNPEGFGQSVGGFRTKCRDHLYKIIKHTIFNSSAPTDPESDARRFGSIPVGKTELLIDAQRIVDDSPARPWFDVLGDDEVLTMVRGVAFSIYQQSHDGRAVPDTERTRELFDALKETIEVEP